LATRPFVKNHKPTLALFVMNTSIIQGNKATRQQGNKATRQQGNKATRQLFDEIAIKSKYYSFCVIDKI